MSKFKRIFFIALAFVAPLAVFASLMYLDYASSVNLAVAQFTDEQAAETKNIGQLIDDDIKRLIGELDFLSQSPEILSLVENKIKSALDAGYAHVKEIYVNDVAFLDADGKHVYAVTAPFLKGTDFSYREYFKKAKAEKERKPIYEFITFMGADAGQKGIIIAMPVLGGKEKKEFQGVVLYTIKIKELIETFAKNLPADYGYNLWLADSKGVVLYHKDYGTGGNIRDIVARDGMSVKFIDNIVAGNGKEGEFYGGKYFTADGTEMLSSFAAINVVGELFIAAIDTPKKDAIKSASDFLVRQFAITFFLVFLIFAASFAFVFFVNKKSHNFEMEAARQKEIDNALLKKEIKEREKIGDDLKNRTAELERMNKVMVGRELEMVKLKQEIMELKNKIGA